MAEILGQVERISPFSDAIMKYPKLVLFKEKRLVWLNTHD